MKPMPRDVSINNQYPSLKYSPASLDTLFSILDSLENYPIPQGELSVTFIDDSTIAQLHDQFMDDPSPTDVITFTGDPSMDFAGEICISIDHAISAAKEHKLPLLKEISLYIIHGWLHLAGLDDIDPADRQLMRHAEQDVLQILENARAFPNFKLSS